jgi:hypothetical protein
MGNNAHTRAEAAYINQQEWVDRNCPCSWQVCVHVSQDLKSSEEQKQGRARAAAFQLKRLSPKVQSSRPSSSIQSALHARTKRKIKDAKCSFIHSCMYLHLLSHPCLLWLHRKVKIITRMLNYLHLTLKLNQSYVIIPFDVSRLIVWYKMMNLKKILN